MAKFVLTAQLELQAPKNSAKIVSDIQQQLKGVTIPLEMKTAADASKQIDKLAESTRQAGSAAEAMGRSFGLAVKRFAAFTVASRAVSLFTNSLASAVDEAIAFQREVVRVSQVTGKPVKDLRDLTDTITRLSVTLGTSSKDLLSTATILAQAGIEAGDLTVALDALAKTTLAPNFDSISETAEGAVAILAQFGQGVGALEQQLSSINAVAGAFAVESEDLIGAVRRFGGVFKASGGSLEELLAVFTSVRATTRESAESISTGLRTIFTRLQRPKTIEFLKQFGVELTTLDGKFVGPFEAAKRLSEVFGQLEQGDITFIRVAEELGGFRQIGKVIPLLQQFALAQEALNVAQSGSDSLAKDAATAQQALAVQITKVKEEFLALVRGIADSESFQLFARTSLEIASALIKVADAIKPLLPLLGTLAAFQFAKGLGTFASSAGAAVRGLGNLGGAQAKNRGGEVLAFASGGFVPGVGNSDTVPAMLTPGEFVIRKSSVNKIGADTLHAMNENRYAKGGLVVQKFEDGGKAKKLTGPTALTPANIKNLGGKAATLEKIKERFNHRITFTANKGEIGGFILTPEQGSDKDYSPNANVLVPLTPQDPAYVKLIHQYDIPEKLTPQEKALINQTQYDPKTPYARTLNYLAQPQNQRPNISAIISKDSTFPEFYPGGRGATETQNKLSEILKDQAAKALGDAGTASANAAKPLFQGLSPIKVDTGAVSSTIQEKIKGDKQAIDTLSGYIFESMIAGVTGAEPTGGKAAFDFDLANNLPEVKNNLGIFFGSQERIKGLKKAEAKKSRGQFAAQDGVLRKLSNSIRGGDFTGLTISDATKQNNPVNPNISKPASKSTSVEPIKTNTAMSDPKALNEGSSGSGAKKALRKVGYIDSDVLNDPRYEGIVKQQIEKLGIKGGHSAYKQYLAEQAVQAKKSGTLGKLTNIVGMAGAGKSSLMLGKQAADQSTLRETQRFPILTPEDIDKASSVINVTASLNEKDVEDFINPADRTVVLSSSTKEEQDVIRKRRKKRDTEITAGTSATGFGRSAGSTKSAPTDSAYIEALIQAGATDPKKVATLGVTEKGFRRKGASELPAVKEELINLFYGNFGPATKGHELARQEGLKQTPGAKSLVAVGIDTPVVEGDEHSYRSALMSQKERTAMAKQVFSGAYVAQANKANYGFSLPSLYEVGANEQGQRTFIKPAKGSTATVGDEKGDKALAKYEKAGLSVVSLPRMEDISGTQLREAAIAKDTNKVKELTTPQGFDFLQGQTSTALGNRAAILPEIINRTFAKSNKKIADIESQIKEILPKGRVGKDTPEDVKTRVAELRKQRDKIKESAGYKPLKTMERLKKFNPEKYAFAKGGAAPSDTVPALLTPGEFVVNREAAQRIGYSNLNRMNKHGVTGFAKGGPVGFRFGGKAAKANIEDSFNREGTALVKTMSDVENVFKNFLSNLTTLPSAVKDAVDKVQTFELTKNQTFTNTNVGRKQTTGDELRGISLGGKVGINLQKGDEHTVKHEVSHEIDRSLGKTTGKAGATASLQEGTFQNKIAKELQITYQKTGDVAKYRLGLEELFADALAKAPPEVQKIIVSTTDAAEGSKKLAEYFEKAGKPVAGLADLSADEFGGVQAPAKSTKATQKTIATTTQKTQQAKQSTNPVTPPKLPKDTNEKSNDNSLLSAKSALIFSSAVAVAQSAVTNFGDKSVKASNALAATTIAFEKVVAAGSLLAGTFALLIKPALDFGSNLKKVGKDRLDAAKNAQQKNVSRLALLTGNEAKRKEQFNTAKTRQEDLAKINETALKRVKTAESSVEKRKKAVEDYKGSSATEFAKLQKRAIDAEAVLIIRREKSAQIANSLAQATQVADKANSKLAKTQRFLSSATDKAAQSEKDLNKARSANRARQVGGAAVRGGAVAGGIVASVVAIGNQIASGFEEYFKRQEEILKSQDNLTGAVEAAGKASAYGSISEAFTIAGFAQANVLTGDPEKFVQQAVQKQQTAEFNVAKEFIPTRTQAALEKIKAGGTKEKPLDEGAVVSKSIEAFSRARSEAQDLKGPAREKALAEINAESRKFISDLAESGMSLEGLKNTAYSLSGGNEDLRKKLLDQVKAIEASRKAQEALNKANLDSLKITSAFGAAADASARLVAGLETGANSLALYSDELENASGRLGVDTTATINAAEKELLSIAGARGGGSLAASISGQAQTARVVSGFSVGAGANLGNLQLSSDQAKAKEQLTDAFNASIPEDADPDTRRKLEALIDKNIASIQGDVSQVDLSKLAKDIQGDAAELSKGFNEAVKLQGQHNATMATLYQKREQLEQKAADAANQAIETQLEAAKIFEEFGGSRLTEQQQLGARISQFNNIGALGGLGAQLSTGSASDIRGVAAEIGRTFAEQTDQVIGTTLARGAGKETGLGAFAGAAGFGADKRPEIEAANKALLQFTKQRVELLKQELSIAQKKNAEEKSSLEALMAGDIEGFLEKQAAAGAGAALAAGSTALTSLFSASALGAGFKTLEGQGLSDKQMRKAEDLTLQRFGIQSTGVLSGTTTQEEALKSQGRELAGVLSEVAQQEASFAQADVSINNATITAAQLSFDRKLTEVANANVGVVAKARGGLIYASRGMFVPRGTDTVPAMLTPGEFVVNRAAVQRGNNLQILTAMNSGGDGVGSPGASSPGAMRGGGRVGYYSAGGEVAGISEAFNTALPQLTAIFTDFATTVEKLVNTKFQVALDPTNINVNFNGTSFLSSLKEELGKELLDKVAQEIKTYKSSTSGDLVKKSVL